MTHKTRLTKLENVRRRRSGGRVLMRYEDGDTFHDGVKIDPATITDADQLIVICYEAKPGTTNLKRLTWGDDNLITSDDAGEPHNLIHDAGDK